jgi:Tfp pilus assembly PilM family ATPase
MLSGGGANVAGFQMAFQERTGLAVEIFNPLARMVPSSKFDPDYLDELAPSLGVSVGLALRQVEAR